MILQRLFDRTMPTTISTIFTPKDETVIKEILISNSSTFEEIVELKIDGVSICRSILVPAKQIMLLSLNTPVFHSIEGRVSKTDVNVTISGVVGASNEPITRFKGGIHTGISTSPQNVYTVPNDKKGILKEIIFTNSDTHLDHYFSIQVGNSTYIKDRINAPRTTTVIPCSLPLNSGESVKVIGDSISSSCTSITVTGVLYNV